MLVIVSLQYHSYYDYDGLAVCFITASSPAGGKHPVCSVSSVNSDPTGGRFRRQGGSIALRKAPPPCLSHTMRQRDAPKTHSEYREGRPCYHINLKHDAEVRKHFAGLWSRAHPPVHQVYSVGPTPCGCLFSLVTRSKTCKVDTIYLREYGNVNQRLCPKPERHTIHAYVRVSLWRIEHPLARELLGAF